MGPETLNAFIERYKEYENIKENKEYIIDLARDLDKNALVLEALVGKRLLFGTAGIRGRMGPGFGQMNHLVIIQTSQGLTSYLLDYFGQEQCSTRGVIIGHDARHNSDKFARLAAQAFIQRKIKVRLCQGIIPTPMVAFGVKHYDCLAGVVITASHNPKWDNGYKVYWSNGAQILSPHDKNIQQHIERESNLKPWPKAWQVDGIEAYLSDLMIDSRDELVTNYYKFVKENSIMENATPSTDLKITYTSMHGVGHEFLTHVLSKLAGFKQIYPVERQQKPDPDFPTVKFPNPEEYGALDLAFETAAETNSKLILAIDPDSDRCAAALYDPQADSRRTLSGDELGAILGWWLWHTRKDAETKAANRYYMLSTAVSSRFLSNMANIEGFNFIETLTGFKYMGNEAEQILKASSENVVLFAYEEAIGYMTSSKILDKDGITAAVQLAQCANYLQQTEKRTLIEQLDWLYIRYGYHYSLNSYYLCEDKPTIAEIFSSLAKSYPRQFDSNRIGDDFEVLRVRDLHYSYDSAQLDSSKPDLPTSQGSYMVTFFVEGNIRITLRTSGTEPKIKYYSEIVADLPQSRFQGESIQPKENARLKLRRFVDSAIEQCLKPKERMNILIPALRE